MSVPEIALLRQKLTLSICWYLSAWASEEWVMVSVGLLFTALIELASSADLYTSSCGVEFRNEEGNHNEGNEGNEEGNEVNEVNETTYDIKVVIAYC